jgi:hypothetical protein
VLALVDERGDQDDEADYAHDDREDHKACAGQMHQEADADDQREVQDEDENADPDALFHRAIPPTIMALMVTG